MRCKILKTQKLMWRSTIRSTKNQKVLVLYYSIDLLIQTVSLNFSTLMTNY